MIDKLDVSKKTIEQEKIEENKSQKYSRIELEEMMEALEKERTDPDSTLADERLS